MKWTSSIIISAFVACGDGGKRPLGANCEDAAECDSGLCANGSCLDPNGDEDGDGVLNAVELALATDPYDPDSDGDGAGDGDEVGADPNLPPDSDGDGIKDALESATEDGDGDCVADQFDPEDKDVRHEHALEVCARIGLCAEHVDSLLATCDAASGAPVWSCDPSAVPGYHATDLTCDGIDEDCDGTTDEDFVAAAVTCAVGSCAATGTSRCADGVLGDTCVGEAAADDATCNGVDDDCDGATDEDSVPSATSCGIGACAATGERRCVDGAPVDDCVAGAASSDDAVCNGADDDCDGATDEDYGVAGADGANERPVTCGEGACQADGIGICDDGVELVDCEPLDVAAADDASCDGSDNDCDGATDEDYVPATTRCGVGACVATGEGDCVDGVVVDSCVPLAAAASDMTCDRVDDDCNGVADEDYAVAITACGVGACAAHGTRSCVDGTLVDSCTPALAAASDATCDGIDDDCDDVADEDYVPVASSCGTGACTGDGVVTCVAGVPRDDCAEEPPDSADDVACDGVDSNCDGATDEGYVAEPTSCGTGACAGSGVTTCVNGDIGDTCSEGAGAAKDEDCDDVDDDCDGATDEDYVAPVTHCGRGGCAKTGTLACEAGRTHDTCVAGTPAGNDSTCDGVDDDCDDDTDEDYLPAGTSCGEGSCEAHGQRFCVGGEVDDSCTPLPAECNGAECGDDGCGGSCGSCGTSPAACVTIGCNADKRCSTDIERGSCYIAGVCYTSGTKNPANDCQDCQPGEDTTGWSPVKRGSVCADEGNTCTVDICDGQGTCGHASVANLTDCNDGDGNTIGDWCLNASCGGFYTKVEPKVSDPAVSLYSEGYRRGASGPSTPSVAGAFYYTAANDEPRASVVHYTTGTTGILPLVMPNTVSGAPIAMDGARVVRQDHMWEYAGSKWTDSRDNNTLRAIWGSDADEFPAAFERLIHYSTGSGVSLRTNVYGAGRTSGDGGLVVRHCSVQALIINAQWACAAEQIATADYNLYPAQLVRAAGTTYLFGNYGSRTSPSQWRALTLSAASNQWAAVTAWSRNATTELRDVIYASPWFVGVGPSNVLWVNKGTAYSDINVGASYNWNQAVVWNNFVVVLGVQGITTQTAVLAYAPLDAYLNDATRWKLHTLWTGQTSSALALVAPNDNELYILGGDRLTSNLISPVVREVWRFTAAHTPL